MKNKGYIRMFLVICTVFLTNFTVSEAQVVEYSNLSNDTPEQIYSSYNYLVQSLGTNLSGTLTQIDLNTSNPASIYYGNRPGISLYECNDSTYEGFATLNQKCSIIFSGISMYSSQQTSSVQSFDTGGVVLDPNKYYFFSTSGNNIFNTLPIYYGSQADTVDGSCYQYIQSQAHFIPCVSVSDLYFNLHGVVKQTTPPPPIGNSSVMFFPGVMSSRLYEELGTIDCGVSLVGNECYSDDELWSSVIDSKQTKLSLDVQGNSINAVYTKDDTQSLNDEAETGVIDEIAGLNIYNSLITSLRNWKQDGTIPDYAFIPYDWRLSLNDIVTNGATTTRNKLTYTNSQNFSESYILKKLQELQRNSPNGKVTLIGHSNGGLVIKALVQKLKDTNNPLYNQIDKIIFVAVPQVGTPDAIVALLHGKPLAKGWIMGNARSRDLSKNMPAVYNLLPSAGYFTTIDPAFSVDKVVSFENNSFFSPQINQYGVYVSNNTELQNYILGTDGRVTPSFGDIAKPNIGNSTLYSDAQSVHAVLDAWQPAQTTKVIQVAGWGEETIAGLDYVSLRDTTEHISYKPRMVVDGDGTVVVPSALWMTESANIERWWVNLEKYNNIFAPNLSRVHRDILEIQKLLNFISSEIKNENFQDSSNILVNNTSTLTSQGVRLHYTLHSPLTLGVTDILGRYTGLDPITGQIKEEIPDVRYEQIGEVQFLSAPSDIALTLKMQGLTTGSFALDIDKQEGNTITANTSFQGIPSTISTKAEINIVPGGLVASSTLKIDQNGDGIVDKTLLAKANGVTLYDTTPPELEVTFSTSTKDVIFSLVDNLDPNPTIFTTSTSTTLVDNQGNTTVIPFTKLRELPTRFRFTYNKIIRNGVVVNLPNTNIVYDWQEKKDVLTDLDTKINVRGIEKYVFSYKKTSNNTTIKEKTGNNAVTTTKSGFIVVTTKTEGDLLKVSY